MLIGTINIRIFIPGSHSLKEKRRVVKSLITRLKNKFNVSVAEIDELEQWQISVIGMAIVGNETRIINQQISKVVSFLEEHTEFDLVEIETCII